MQTTNISPEAIDSSVDKNKLLEFMKAGWSWRGSESKAVLTEEDKDELATQVISSLGAEIVDGVAVIGKTEVSE